MGNDRRDAVRPHASPGAVMTATLPLIRHAGADAVVAYRGGEPIGAGRFLGDVAALAALLPPRGAVINLCGDRYRFTVGLAAALSRRQVSLLPPNDTPGMLEQIAADFPDSYCLSDGTRPPLSISCLAYPEVLAAQPVAPAILGIPAGQTAVVLFTSGSTGRPKPHGKSWGALVRSTLAAGQSLDIAALRQATVVGTVPHQHSYGLESTVLLALQHGLSFQAERPFYAADICAALDRVPRPRLLVTTPIHLRVLLAEEGAVPTLDLVLSATAPLAPQTASAAEARFRAPLWEIYGCSEAGQVAIRRTVASEEWRCMSGITLRQDEQGTWAGGAPIETEALLNDVIELHGPDRFLLHGRTADLVNIAGKRTSLAHLNYHLNSIAGVRDGVFVMPEEIGEGVTRLMAFVVAPGVAPATILAALRQRIDAAFLPRPLCFADALPRNATGKLPREAILRLVAKAG
jgi:acyl-coenzyme A synthetase/AMP-(fatty) acid ligase